MSRLYITPRHGYLGQTLEALKADYPETGLVGYGYPPLYVDTDEKEHRAIRRTVENIDAEATFKLYRTDLMDVEEWADFIKGPELITIIRKFTPAEFGELCLRVNIPQNTLQGHLTGDLPLMTTNLVASSQTNNQLPALVEAAYEMKPNLF